MFCALALSRCPECSWKERFLLGLGRGCGFRRSLRPASLGHSFQGAVALGLAQWTRGLRAWFGGGGSIGGRVQVQRIRGWICEHLSGGRRPRSFADCWPGNPSKTSRIPRCLTGSETMPRFPQTQIGFARHHRRAAPRPAARRAWILFAGQASSAPPIEAVSPGTVRWLRYSRLGADQAGWPACQK